MKIKLDSWTNGVALDWCISRQRYFGVPFPVWYLLECENYDENRGSGTYIGRKIEVAHPDDLPVNPLVDLPRGYELIKKNGAGDFFAKEIATGKIFGIKGDKDVMDTWATSSVSPQLSSHGINGELGAGNELIDNERHKKLFPADLRPQAHEIIRTWAFYTIVKAYLHENTIPWKDLMISGWCLAEDKTKMSKSKGNVVTPVTMIEEKGSDVVRYWASTSRLGSDTAYSEDVLKVGKKLINKLWNATKFASIQMEGIAFPTQTANELVADGIITESLDKWVISRLNKTIKKATQEFDKYEYCIARMAIEDFFWNDFCDNYLELAKTRAYGEGDITAEASNSAKYTLYYCIDAILKLFAPFTPHICDTLYSHIFEEDFAENKSVNARGMWCHAENYPVDEEAEQAGILCVEVLEEIRKAKSEAAVSIKYPVEKLILPEDKKSLLMPVLDDLKNAGSVESIEWGGFLEIELKEVAE